MRSPTTTGKIERLQRELLDDHGPFASIQEAQVAIDAWRQDYNHIRPHQALGMANPAQRFCPSPPGVLPLKVPAELDAQKTTSGPTQQAVSEPASSSEGSSSALEPHTELNGALELERVVPASGNLWLAGQQLWLGPGFAGRPIGIWVDTTSMHLSVDGQHLKTVPSRLSALDLAKLAASGAQAAVNQPPARPALASKGSTSCCYRSVSQREWRRTRGFGGSPGGGGLRAGKTACDASH